MPPERSTGAETSRGAPQLLRPPVDFRVGTALAFLCGILYFLAFPGIDVWPLSVVTWVPLLVALRGQSAKRALWLGWVAGFTMTMVGFYWLLEMLRTFSGFATPLCLFFMAFVCAYQAGRIALMTWLYARATIRGWSHILAFVLAFSTSELVFPLLFPWTFAATVHQIPALLQSAELGGQILVGVALVAANLAVAEPLMARLEGRSIHWRSVAVLALVPSANFLYGLIRLPQIDALIARASRVKVGVVQANMSLMGKRRNKQEGLRRNLELTEQLRSAGGLDLVVWAETSVAGAVPEASINEVYPQRFTRSLGVPTIFGGVLFRSVEDERGHVFYNSALSVDAQGNITGRYDKQYLLAFGEYLPLGDSFPILYSWSPHSGRFTPGTSMDSVPVGDKKVGVLICYEDIIPAFVNGIVNQDQPQLLVNMTNDAWFGDTTEPWIHWALSKLRAVEQRRYLARANNSGVSGFIDPAGRDISHTETFTEAALAADLAWLDEKTLFRSTGHAPWWVGAALSTWMAFRRRRNS